MYEFSYSNPSSLSDTSDVTVAVDCRAHPSLYLGMYRLLGRAWINESWYWSKEITMIFVESSQYRFVEEIVSSIQLSEFLLSQIHTHVGVALSYETIIVSFLILFCVEDHNWFSHVVEGIQQLYSHQFYQLDGEDRWNLCWAARNRIRPEIKLTSSSGDKDDLQPQMFLVNSKKLHVAIKCPTAPVMYLRLEKSTPSAKTDGDFPIGYKKTIKIMFAESDLKDYGLYN